MVLLGENGDIVRFAYIPIDDIIYDTFDDDTIDDILFEMAENFSIENEFVGYMEYKEVDLEEVGNE